MSDNKRPPGYVPLTIHELAAGHKGKRGTAFDYVFSLDARAVDDSVLASSAARAATGTPRNGGRPHGDRQQEGGFSGGGRDQNRGESRGRRGSRRGRNNRRGYGGQDGDANFADNNGNGNGGGSGAGESAENYRASEGADAPAERVQAYEEE